VSALDRGEVMDLVYDASLVLVLPRLRVDPTAEVDTTEHDARSAWAGLVCSLCLHATPGEA
jgi:hypothetical protein